MHKRVISRPVLILLLLDLSVFAFSLQIADSASTYARAWRIEEIGKYAVDISVYHSLALDSLDRPHISYWDDTLFAMDLAYKWWDGTAWMTTKVDRDGDVGRFSSIALDSNDYPHITYFNYSSGQLKYAWWDGTTWHKEIIGPCGRAGLGGGYSSIALDSNDHPHISWFNGGYMDLWYATWDGTTWHKEKVEGEGGLRNVGHYNSIALDSLDRPHISYYDYDWGNLRYAWWNGTAWTKETVDSSARVGMYTSIAIDSNDKPHISYYDFSYKSLKYANRTGKTWHYESVDSIGDVGLYSSIALDSNDRPHISYYKIDPDFILKYATKAGTAWSIDEVDLLEDFTDTDFAIKVYSSIALDSGDYPHITYADMYWMEIGGKLTFNWYLKYATAAPHHVDVTASDPDGHFSVTIDAGTDKGAPVTSWTEISTTNIATYTVTLTSGDMVMVIEGQLEDSSLPGQIVLQVDPEGEIVNYQIDVHPCMPWDITGPTMWVPDGKCDMRDVALIAKLFGSIEGDGKYDVRADITGPTYLVADGKIDMRDVALVAKHYGEIY